MYDHNLYKKGTIVNKLFNNLAPLHSLLTPFTSVLWLYRFFTKCGMQDLSGAVSYISFQNFRSVGNGLQGDNNVLVNIVNR